MDRITCKLEFEDNVNKKYKIEAIFNSVIYIRKSESGHLPGLYNLILWKGYSKNENTWEPVSAVQHFWKLLNTFHKKHLHKPIANSPPIDLILSTTKLIVMSFLNCSGAKQKLG